MVFKINNTDIKPFIAPGGIQWQLNDVEDPDAGRALDALMYRGRIAMKVSMKITCRPLKAQEVQTVLNLIIPEFVTVSYTDPLYGNVERTMYSNNRPAVHMIEKPNGDVYWTGINFPLVER